MSWRIKTDESEAQRDNEMVHVRWAGDAAGECEANDVRGCRASELECSYRIQSKLIQVQAMD